MYYNEYNPYSLELYHHGIQGQKWGVRRYQYEDGSLTPEGKKRYYVNGEDPGQGYTLEGEKWQRQDKAERKRFRRYKKAYKEYYADKKKYGFKDTEHNIRYEYLKKRDAEIEKRNKAIRKAVTGVAVTATTAVLAYKFGPTLWKNYGAPWMHTQITNVKTAALNKGKELIRDAVNEAVENANKTATKAAQAAVDTAKSTVTNVATNASKAVNKAATNASKTVSRTATNVSKSVRTGASKAGKVAQDIWIPKSWRR